MLRYMNMFVLIGIALVGISLAGFATNNRFLIEPGQGINPYASLVYLCAGAVMIANGIVSVRTMPAPQRPAKQTPAPAAVEEYTEEPTDGETEGPHGDVRAGL